MRNLSKGRIPARASSKMTASSSPGVQSTFANSSTSSLGHLCNAKIQLGVTRYGETYFLKSHNGDHYQSTQ